MLRIGLTGGIGSGKSTVAELFAARGVPIVDTDIIAREVVAVGEPGLAAVVDAFGPQVLRGDGSLDRAALRERVFADARARERLECILHPLIRMRTLSRLARLDAPYALVVVPLLVETGFETLVDRVLVVDCPRETQLERLMNRDVQTRQQAESMLAAQASREARLRVADDVVDNGGSLDRTRRQVERLHRRYLKLASELPQAYGSRTIE